ncbi:S-layer protein domain-containing protein [Methanosarcina hadiensis]|uniref:S-layer protein domain-containing protein n=1 Tax=Methanosarcina hadiensis TaxID=3078083 RepID=UPI0039777AF6
MVLFITIPAEGAIEQRGQILNISAGDHHILNAENCPGFYYSTTSGTYYESLELTFSEDGFIETGDAIYTCKVTSGSTAFFGKKYKVLEDGLITESLISSGSRDLQRGNDFDLGNGRKLVLEGVNGNYALLDFQKNSISITNKTVEEGSKFNFTTEVDGTEYVMLEGTLEKVLDSKDPIVRLKSVNHYSDTPIKIEKGDEYGRFEVTAVTNKSIELKNSAPIRMQPEDHITILDDLIDLRVADNVYRACSYNMTADTIKSYKIRGTSLTVNRSDSSPDSCIWTADSFGMLFYDSEYDLSTERLEMSLDAENDWISEGNLVYESVPVKVAYENPEMMDYEVEWFNQGYSVLGWNGKEYAHLGADKGIVNILLEEDDRILYPDEEYDLKEGYTLKVTDLDSDNACLTLSRNNLPVYSSIISPGKSADLGTHTFLYKKELNGVEVPLFSVYVDSVIQGKELSAVNLKHLLHFSDSPLELNYGKRYGELTVVETYPKLRLENKHAVWSGSDINVTEDIWIGMFEKTTSGKRSVTFYPYMNKVETVESILPSVSGWSIPAMSIEEYLTGA